MKTIFNYVQAVLRIPFTLFLVIYCASCRPPSPPTPTPWNLILGSFQDQDGGGRVLTIDSVSPSQVHVKITLVGRNGASVDLTGTPSVLDSRRFQLQGINLATKNAESIIVEITSSTKILFSRKNVPFTQDIVFQRK